MTTLTGETKMSLAGTVNPPPYAAAMLGACLQLGSLAYVWREYTSAHDCLTSPLHCLTNLRSADPWGRQAVLTAAGALCVWALSVVPLLRGEAHSDPSIVDRLWSVQPWLYCWHFFASSSAGNQRMLLMALLTSAWGARLTWNFFVKGGYSGGEDYRWKEIRSWYPGWKYELFNLTFICGFQQIEILAFTTPAVLALQSNRPLCSLDYVAAGLFLFFLGFEATADRQMLDFQTEKYRRIRAGESLGPEYSHGFIQTGLWAHSRHPNYFAEVSLWWVFYLFSVAATGEWLNWSILGTVFLTGMFVLPSASLDVTEALSSRKYAQYPEYQARVSRFFPLPQFASAAPQKASSSPQKASSSPQKASSSPAENTASPAQPGRYPLRNRVKASSD